MVMGYSALITLPSTSSLVAALTTFMLATRSSRTSPGSVNERLIVLIALTVLPSAGVMLFIEI